MPKRALLSSITTDELIGLCSQHQADGDDSIALVDVTDDQTIDARPVVATTVAP